MSELLTKLNSKLRKLGFDDEVIGPVERTYAGKYQKRDSCHVWNARLRRQQKLIGSSTPLSVLVRSKRTLEVSKEHGFLTIDELPVSKEATNNEV